METEVVSHVSERTLKYYDYKANPIYGVPKAKGNGATPATVTHARKLGLYPSIGSVIKSVLGKSKQLEDYISSSIAITARHEPFQPEVSDEEFALEVVRKAREDSNSAATRGTELHMYINQWVEQMENTVPTGEYPSPDDPAADMIVDALVEKCNEMEITRLDTEYSVVNPGLGYGGTPDLVGFRGETPVAIIDLKTTNMDTFKTPYREWIITLGGYKKLIGVEDVSLMNMVSDRGSGNTEFYPHDEDSPMADAIDPIYETWVLVNSMSKQGPYDPRLFAGERWSLEPDKDS